MTHDYLTACVCGSTSFEVSESQWHPATIDDGYLVLTDTDGVDGGFETAVCTECSTSYDTSRFDCENLLDNYGA